MSRAELVLVHGLFLDAGARDDARLPDTGAQRRQRYREHAGDLGIVSCEWFDGHRRALVNRMLRRMRGTAPTVDAVEIIELEERALRDSLATESGRRLWHDVAGCTPYDLDVDRSFILIGAPRQLLAGPDSGPRVLWFGNGLENLSREDFIRHYTQRHGPLVAGHARAIGLRAYRQIPSEREDLCAELRACGLGRAPAPAVFAELLTGAPSLRLVLTGAQRAATREIQADEKRHIDFPSSMLLLPAR